MTELIYIRRAGNGWIACLYRGRQNVDLVGGPEKYIAEIVRQWQRAPRVHVEIPLTEDKG